MLHRLTKNMSNKIKLRQSVLSGFCAGAMLLQGTWFFSQPASAFDTGHHSDLTFETLRAEGFNPGNSIAIARLENWLADYYNSPAGSAVLIKNDVENLHFDNQFLPQDIENYWKVLSNNTRDAVKDAAERGDVLDLLTIIGTSLHTVQDFYSHSSWIEYHNSTPTAYKPISYFDDPEGQKNPGLRTGRYDHEPITKIKSELDKIQPHGDYTSGLNQDSYSRPRWDKAYVFAYYASRQWVNQIHEWVKEVPNGENVWNSAKNYSLDATNQAALTTDLIAMYRLSEWINVLIIDNLPTISFENGHWKGKGSGLSLTQTDSFLNAAEKWATTTSVFTRQYSLRRVHRRVSAGLGPELSRTNPTTLSLPTIPPYSLQERAIIVRTVSVSEVAAGSTVLSCGDSIINRFELSSYPDYYARISVAGQLFIDAVQRDNNSIYNPPVPYGWTTIKFVPNSTTTVPIRYELWDEDNIPTQNPNILQDEQCDINPSQVRNPPANNLRFNYDVLTNKLSGDNDNLVGYERGFPGSVTRPLYFQGNANDPDQAKVGIFVTSKPLF